MIDGTWDITITLADLDDNGLYWLKNPDDSSDPIPWMFMATKLYVDVEMDGYLNFDFIGSYYSWSASTTGSDDFDNLEIGLFLVVGECAFSHKPFYLFTTHFSSRGWI